MLQSIIHTESFYQSSESVNKYNKKTEFIKINLFQTMIESRIKSPAKDYPLEDVQYQLLSQQKKALVKKICYLFVFYAAKGSKHGYYELQEHYFMELMQQVWDKKGGKLHKNKGQWKDLQLLYHSKGIKNSLSFKNFLQLLPTLSMYLQPDMSRQDSLKSMMHQLNNVYEDKIAQQIQGKLINFELNVEQDTKEFISKLVPDLAKLYKVYFPQQINHKVKTKYTKSQSIESYTQFLKDFEVFPKIISARDIFYIFNEGCDAPPSELLYQTEDSKSVLFELGEVFRFSKFVESLIIVSKRVFPKLKQVQNEQDWQHQQKYLLRTLLEYMQTIKATNKKKTKFMNERFSFIVLEEHPEQEQKKTFYVKDKIVKQSVSNMNFFSLMDKLQL